MFMSSRADREAGGGGGVPIALAYLKIIDYASSSTQSTVVYIPGTAVEGYFFQRARELFFVDS